MGGEKLMSLAV